MNDEELRLKCLELGRESMGGEANNYEGYAKGVVTMSKVYCDYVKDINQCEITETETDKPQPPVT